MADDAARTTADIRFEELAQRLEVLANGNRLKLLHQLLKPKALSEIDLRPGTVKAGENPLRPISRQAVQRHLERLASIGITATFRARRGKSLVDVHTINYPRLFAMVEDLRSLGQLRPAQEAENLATIAGTGTPAPAPGFGPLLVIVRGLQEGTTYPLHDAACTTPGRWVLGRKRGVPVCIDYDPYVSAENTEFARRGEKIVVRSMPASRNGTRVNWRLLGPDEAESLRHGDVIGVGKTLLLFRES